MFEITQLFYYPVKSLGAVQTENVNIDDFGIQHDRRFMLIDDNGTFVTQRLFPTLSLLNASIEGNTLLISGETLGLLSFDLSELSGSHKIKVWSDFVDAELIDNKLTRQLSEFVGINVRLAYMPDSSYRQVDRDYFADDQRVSFADGFPFLLTNQSSLNDLNNRLEASVPMSRFRPNIVFSGDQPFQEDSWRRVRMGSIDFELVKPCSRCVMTTINDKAEKTREPLLALSRYRKNTFGICFGQNLVHLGTGQLKVGDTLKVLD